MKILIALIALSCACNTALAQAGKLVHKEEKRKYIVYTPASYHSEAQQSYPVVFNFHGGGMSMTEQMLYSQMNRTADRHRFIVVYPQGIKQDWNVGFDMPYLEGTDDVGFTQALLAKLKQDYRIDGSRVYATGLSRGGFFALRLAADLPEVFAAVASVGGPTPKPLVQHHTKMGKVGVMLIHGRRTRWWPTAANRPATCPPRTASATGPNGMAWPRSRRAHARSTPTRATAPT